MNYCLLQAHVDTKQCVNLCEAVRSFQRSTSAQLLLERCHLENDGWILLFEALAEAPRFVGWHFVDCAFDADACTALRSAFRYAPWVRSIDVRGCGLSDMQLDALAQAALHRARLDWFAVVDCVKKRASSALLKTLLHLRNEFPEIPFGVQRTSAALEVQIKAQSANDFARPFADLRAEAEKAQSADGLARPTADPQVEAEKAPQKSSSGARYSKGKRDRFRNLVALLTEKLLDVEDLEAINWAHVAVLPPSIEADDTQRTKLLQIVKTYLQRIRGEALEEHSCISSVPNDVFAKLKERTSRSLQDRASAEEEAGNSMYSDSECDLRGTIAI